MNKYEEMAPYLKDLEIFIISIADRYSFLARRLKSLEVNLQKLSLLYNTKFNIHYVGIDGRKLIDKKINKKYIDPYYFSIEGSGLGGAGCALSHILILKLIKLRKLYKNILVLEEDARLLPHFFKIFKYFPKDYDLLFLHSYDLTNYFTLPEHPDYQFFRRIEKLITKPCGAQCYVINGKNIDKIIKELLPIKHGLDHEYLKPNGSENRHDLQKYLIHPGLELCINTNFGIGGSIREIIDQENLKSG